MTDQNLMQVEEEEDSEPTKIVLSDFFHHNHDKELNFPKLNLQFTIRDEMMKNSKERTRFLERKLLILNQIKHSTVPFVPNQKPFDFSLDREVALAVAKRHGTSALKILHETFRNDREIVLKAASNDDFVNSDYIGKNLRRDRTFVKELVQGNWILLKDMDSDIKEDEKICRAALESNVRAVRFVSNQELLNSREVMLPIVKEYGLALEFIGNSLKNDREIVLAALNQNPNAFRFVVEEMLNDEEVSQFSKKVNSLELHIKSLVGRNLTVYAEPSDSFNAIRQQVRELWGEVENCRFLCNSKVIPDNSYEKTLEELGINSDSKLFMVFRLRGG